RQDYEEEIAAQGYPLDAETLEELRDWQQTVLGLEDRDVEPVQREIEARYGCEESGQRPSERPQSNTSSRVESEPSFLKTFSFDVVRVDAEGKTIQREQKQAMSFAEDLGNGVTLEMVQIPGGEFLMGSRDREKGYGNERPQHEVTVPSLFMGKFVVTQAQYEAVMAENPATQYDSDRFVAPNKPVVGVSWHDAIVFCEKLSQRTRWTYRLPSEAEWEYACRAGTETPFYLGETITTDLANYRGTDFQYEGRTYLGNYGSGPKGIFRGRTTSAEEFTANLFGLFDMHGNVWEWCLDHWHASYEGAPADGSAWLTEKDEASRVLRGGSWSDYPEDCRSAIRSNHNPAVHDYVIGFRVVCGSARTPNSAG
ncbi:MAG: formylglycine-generating enzyme family protein, partial [Elainellaceae cyanobacterium]